MSWEMTPRRIKYLKGFAVIVALMIAVAAWNMAIR